MADTVLTVERTPEKSIDQKIDQLAEVAVKVGLGLKAGQELLMTASLDALPLARRITEHAYRAGATLVTTLYTDDEATLMRYHSAPDASFDRAPGWLYDGMGAAFKAGTARLAIAGGNPSLLSNGRLHSKWAGANRRAAISQSPIVPRSSSLPATRSIGPLLRAPRRRGPPPCFPTKHPTPR